MHTKIIVTIVALSLGATAIANAASDMPGASHDAVQPSPHAEQDQRFVFRQNSSDPTLGTTAIQPQSRGARMPRTGNDFNWLSGGGG